MTNAELNSILDQLAAYLATEKKFVVNPMREADFTKAIKIAATLFPDAKMEIDDDPLQMGAGILRIEGYDINITGEREIELFSDFIKLADNFEIYPIDAERIRFAAVFQHVLVRI